MESAKQCPDNVFHICRVSTMFKPEEIQGFTQLFLKDVITVSDGITHANMSAGLFVFIHI